MVANLSGIRFDQVYGDNSGGAEFDTDGDGTATQEDEFVSFTNDSGSAMDISGWQIWSDSSGTGAPDTPQDGLFHTFPPGTVLATGQTLFVINEITGTAPDWAQEASQGGTESGAGGVNTNFLSEGTNGGAATDGVALVNPATGEYIVFNLAANPHIFSSMPGFPGTTMVGEVDGAAVQEDQNAGSVYRYNSGTDSYDYTAMSFACFASGTRLLTSSGLVPVEHLCVGAPLVTRDHGLQRIEWVGKRHFDAALLKEAGQHPIEFKPGSLGPGIPTRALRVSPQHRMLVGPNTLAPAKGMVHLPKVRVMQGCKRVTYHHVLLARHQIIFAEGAMTESFLPGETFLKSCSVPDRLAISAAQLEGATSPYRCLTVQEARKTAPDQLLMQS